MTKLKHLAAALAVLIVLPVSSQAWNGDSLRVSCDTCDLQTVLPVDTDSLIPILNPLFVLDPAHYHSRYNAWDLLYKITDNQGNGFEDLYGTRNLRVVLHGAAYRGGANNYFHRDGRRNNQNPLPNDGVRNLCEEGFSASVYLYRRNWDDAPTYDSCDCINEVPNELEYVQLDYHDDKHVREMLELVYKAATDDNTGPVYLHCWNGWHASGFISAVILKQFCSMSSNDAVNYWDLGTDGMNRSPRYQTQRERIKKFVPYRDLLLSDSLQDCLCPYFPDEIDSSQLHIDLDHLITVPEAIPTGHTIALSNIKFKPGSTSFSSLNSAKRDMDKVIKALNNHPGMVLEIGGHTDNSGKSSTNYSLSKERAQRVYNYLIKQGVSADRLSWKGYGPSKPIASNKYKSTRAQNRRIEVKLVSKGNVDNTRLVEEEKYDNPEFREAPEKDPEDKRKPDPVRTNNVGSTDTRPAVDLPTPPANLKPTLDNLSKYPNGFSAGEKILLPAVKFEPYSVKVSSSAQKDLRKIVQAMKDNPDLKLEIGGYSDDSGDYEGNVKLSKQRAKSVYSWLVSNGVSSDRLSYRGYGPKSPRYSNKTKEGRAKNRRIEVKVK